MPDYDFSGSNVAPWYSQREKIKKVIIKIGVTNIGSYAFCNCSSLTSVVIPNSVTSIGDAAISSCSGLTSVTIPNSVTSIGDVAFYGCSGLTSVTIPNSVTRIGDYAFQNCSGLTSITIPNSVTSVGRSAFSGCSGLTSFTIPNSVTSIGGGVFAGCSGLTSVTIPNSVTSVGRSAFYGCSGLTSFTIPNSVTSIESYAFSGCSGLTSVTIPNSVTSIGNNAFQDCSGLTSITIPNFVTSIGWSAFNGCSGLSSLTIPNSVTSIESYAFSGCSGLTSITIPNSVTSIGEKAFYGCLGVKELYSWNVMPPACGGDAFDGMNTLHARLFVPEGSGNDYSFAKGWMNFMKIYEIAYNAVNLTNSKAYMLKSANEGSYLFYDSVNDCVAALNETALDDTEENVTWMTTEVDGKHYVYNLGAKKFLVADKANAKTGYRLSDVPVSIDIEDGKDAIVFGKSKEFYMVINDKLNVDEGLESQIIATTGIKGISVEANQPTVTYNVNGQIVPDNTKGLHIRNGKKVVIK